MEDIWDPDRLKKISSVMERYSSHLSEGDRIRLGMEGDPCYIYRSTDEAPQGTVVSVHDSGHDKGMLRFVARLDSDETLIELDNRNVDPSKLWEIHPEYIETFQGKVNDRSKGQEEEKGGDDLRQEVSEIKDFVETFRGQEDTLRQELNEFKSNTASTLRFIASDLIRVAGGQTLEFSEEYADRYDMAISRGTNTTTSSKSEKKQKNDHVEFVKAVDYSNGYSGSMISESAVLTD